MKISIFGLGYVGAVTAGCLTHRNHEVIGVDVHPQKVEDFNHGRAPIVEPRLDELLKTAHQEGRLRATTSCEEAIAGSEASIVCVGTPSAESGALNLQFVRQVAREIAQALLSKTEPHSIIFRSTMLPGSTQSLAEEFFGDGLRENKVDIFFYPEFLREGTAVSDFENPALVVVGTREGSAAPEKLKPLFGDSFSVVNWNTAEMIKYACNAFHATKIAFANEIGRIGKQLNIDAQTVMSLLCQDTQLNISSYYLRPGNPFGGSCLPKDVKALTHCARQNDVKLPLVENLILSNEEHLASLLNRIKSTGQREIVILGLSFKSKTDDLRESPMVEVAQHFLGRGYEVRIYDPQLNLSRLIGSNKRVIDEKMPHLASLLTGDLRTALGEQGALVVGHKCASIEELRSRVNSTHHLIDVNGWPELQELPAIYHGFCW